MGDRKKTLGSARNLARERAIQALYQRELTDQEIADIRSQFLEDQDMSELDLEYFETLLSGVTAEQDRLDAGYAPYLDRAVPSLDVIERVILRLACYELFHEASVPYRVVINEAVELAKRFGGDKGHKYVNAVLDKVARSTRAVEMQA